MKNRKKIIAILLAVFAGFAGKTIAQQSTLDTKIAYIFNSDSLSGFDEQSTSTAALTEGLFGQDFKLFMHSEKRKFINAKYNIQVSVVKFNAASFKPLPAKFLYTNGQNSKSAAALPSSGACANDDFEDAQINPGPQVAGAINGWTVTGSTNYGGGNFCNPAGAALAATALYTVFNAPTTDPLMLFPNNTISSYFDATSTTQPAGNCFIRLNDASENNKTVKAVKIYTVTPNNALFRYAYRAVIGEPTNPHTCCGQSGFQIKVTITNTATGTSTLLPCPQVSVAAGNACGPAAPGFLKNGENYYNPNWVPAAIDLSANIGDQVTLDIYAIDCTGGGHTGYVYFDALCSPMTILGNNNPFPAGTPSITLPTCGANGATIIAPPGMGNYSWSSGQIPITPASLGIPSPNNATLTSALSGTVLLSMLPQGACAPINKVITITITPAPQVVATATQAGCTNSISAASIVCAGSASVNPVIKWLPAPATISGNSLNVTGLPIGITTVTATDPLGCKVTATLNILPAPPAVTFAVSSLNGYTSTCQYPNIILQANSNYNYNNGAISYTWTAPWLNTASTAPSSVTVPQANAPTTITIIGTDHATGCQFTQTVAIAKNSVLPTIGVNPITQAVTCNTLNAPVTFTGTVSSPTINVLQDWYSPLNPLPAGVPILSTNSNTSILSGVLPTGVYTLVTTNLVNGCKQTATVSVTSLDYYPTFTPFSTTGYTLGCGAQSVTVLSILNPSSTIPPPALPGVTSYTFLPPNSAAPIPTANVLGANTSVTTSIPGTWTVIVNDNANTCKTILTIPITQNTVTPDIGASMLTHTLTCFNPTILATGTSTTANNSIQWGSPGIGFATTPTIEIIPGTPGNPSTSTTSLAYATYTVRVTDNANGCITNSLVVISQNFKAPGSTPLISLATPTAIYCNVGTAPVVLDAVGSVQNPSPAFPSPFLWEGPSPQGTVTGASSYSCYVPGIYTLTIKDSYNGCTKSGTVNVVDKSQLPVITTPSANAILNCGKNTALLTINLTGGTSGFNYRVTEYPAGASFFPPSAPIGGTASNTISVSMPGHYQYKVTNTLTQCSSFGEYDVVPGAMTVDFDASQYSGFAPMVVNFNNLSHTDDPNSKINSVWNFGNGSSQTTTSNPVTSTSFNSPGTYTVVLTSQTGTCIGSTSKVIVVDIPSKLEVPNVFTPNGDNTNDVFFLKVANLTEINALIFDRWGNKVYDVNSSTGNIAWDGKNLQGQECAAGVYFYIIKANGKDNKEYETKGNVSLFR